MSEEVNVNAGFGDSELLNVVKCSLAAVGAGSIVNVMKQDNRYLLLVRRQNNGNLKTMTVSLPDLETSNGGIKLQGEMNSLGLADVYELLKTNASNEEICNLLNTKFEEYQSRVAQNKLAESKEKHINDQFDKMIEAYKGAGMSNVVEKIRNIKNIILASVNDKKKQVNPATQEAESPTATEAQAEV